MKKLNERHLSVRISDNLLKKFRYVCAYDGRSANSQILILIRNCIEEYEKQIEKIDESKLM